MLAAKSPGSIGSDSPSPSLCEKEPQNAWCLPHSSRKNPCHYRLFRPMGHERVRVGLKSPHASCITVSGSAPKFRLFTSAVYIVFGMMAAGDTMGAAVVAAFSLLEIVDMNRKHTNWAALLELSRHQGDADDVNILQLLASGNSTPKIARIMGVSRSKIWRTSQRLKTQLEELLTPGEP